MIIFVQRTFMPIVPAQAPDIPLLVRLVNGAYRGTDGMKGWTDESHLLEGARTDAGGILELMNDDHSVILKYIDPEERVAGCVYLQKRGDRLYLGLLSVLPELQGTGLGKELLGAADDHARENHCLHIYITVISARHELVAWYERHGYRRTGETEPFHAGEKFGIQKQPLELIVLVKNLS
jgi:GNAT superfamily N-acetyltransferase